MRRSDAQGTRQKFRNKKGRVDHLFEKDIVRVSLRQCAMDLVEGHTDDL